MLLSALIVLAVWAPSSLPQSQARSDLPTELNWEPKLQQPPPVSREESLHLDVTLHGRSTIPFGWVDRDVIAYGGGVFVVDEHLSWMDLFDPGWGAALTLDLTRGPSRTAGGGSLGSEMGGYFSFEYERFAGNSESDGFGNSVSADDLEAETLLVGVKVVHPLGGGAFSDGRFGLGAVHYSAVHAAFSGPLFPKFKDTLFNDTWNFALEAQAHAGYRFGALSLVLGIGFKLMLPPDEGPRVSLSTGPIYALVFDLGVELGF